MVEVSVKTAARLQMDAQYNVPSYAEDRKSLAFFFWDVHLEIINSVSLSFLACVCVNVRACAFVSILLCAGVRVCVPGHDTYTVHPATKHSDRINTVMPTTAPTTPTSRSCSGTPCISTTHRGNSPCCQYTLAMHSCNFTQAKNLLYVGRGIN